MKERGFTLVEILLTLAVLAFVTLSVATGVGAGHRATKALEEEAILFSQGQEYLERLLVIPFGREGDLPATGVELSEVWDNDDQFGTITLFKLANFGPSEFELASFPVAGRWRVTVSSDLNGDGDTLDEEEGRDDLLRIEVRHEGRLIARSVRFNPTG